GPPARGRRRDSEAGRRGGASSGARRSAAGDRAARGAAARRRGRLPPPPVRKERRRAAAPPAPSSSARAALGPYARGRLMEKAPGFPTLALDVPWDVFSSQRIDEGTLLLLRHLPEGQPSSFLDLGCGYGALGLPVAARWPAARALLIDRDLLAVAGSAHN